MSIRILRWINDHECLYATKDYFEPADLAKLEHLIPDGSGSWRRVVSVEKEDSEATEEWPHVYRVTVGGVDVIYGVVYEEDGLWHYKFGIKGNSLVDSPPMHTQKEAELALTEKIEQTKKEFNNRPYKVQREVRPSLQTPVSGNPSS